MNCIVGRLRRIEVETPPPAAIPCRTPSTARRHLTIRFHDQVLLYCLDRIHSAGLTPLRSPPSYRTLEFARALSQNTFFRDPTFIVAARFARAVHDHTSSDQKRTGELNRLCVDDSEKSSLDKAEKKI
jgi:hypothetical protein